MTLANDLESHGHILSKVINKVSVHQTIQYDDLQPPFQDSDFESKSHFFVYLMGLHININ